MIRYGVGEIVAAAIILAAAAVVSTIMLGAFSESAQVMTDDTRSRMNRLRAEAVEQIDVTSRECQTGKPLTFLVVNYGDFPTSMPFKAYDQIGGAIHANITYVDLDNTRVASCSPSWSCTDGGGNSINLYDQTLNSKYSVLVQVDPWPCLDPLILLTDTGDVLWVAAD